MSSEHYQFISPKKKSNRLSENVESENESNYEENSQKEKTANSALNHEAIQEKTKIQKEKHNEWFEEDRNSVGMFLNKNFVPSSDKKAQDKSSLIFEENQASSKFISNNFTWKILNNDWKTFEKELNPNYGISLKQTIIRLNNPMNLRSLSCKMQLVLKLKASSMVTIIMRSTENFENEESYIIQYRKEGFSDFTRCYFLIGKRDKAEYIFIKKCEIPILNPTLDLTADDILSLVIEIMDFGDDKIHIYNWIGDKMGKPFKLKYEGTLTPFFENFKIYFMGNSDESFLRSIMIELFDGYEFFMEKQNKHFCSKCRNCIIF